jgi:hypothetical protein
MTARASKSAAAISPVAAIWSVEHPSARVALWTLFAAGWTLVLVVTFLINHFDLFGLRQVWRPLIGRPYTKIDRP